MSEELGKLVRELRELKRIATNRSDERVFYQRVVFLITVLAFVLGGVGFYFRTNAQILQTIDIKVREVKSELMALGEGKGAERKIGEDERAASRILATLDEIRRAISDLDEDVQVVRDEVRSMAKGEDR